LALGALDGGGVIGGGQGGMSKEELAKQLGQRFAQYADALAKILKSILRAHTHTHTHTQRSMRLRWHTF